MAKWLDLSKHNAALWADNPNGELVVLPINPNQPIFGHDDILFEDMTDPNGGELTEIGFKAEHNPNGDLISLRVKHDPDTPEKRLRASRWMHLFPMSVPRETETMLQAFPPSVSERDPSSPWLWLWQVIEPDAEALGADQGRLDAMLVQPFALSEEDALRYGAETALVTPDSGEIIPVGFGIKPGVIWGVNKEDTLFLPDNIDLLTAPDRVLAQPKNEQPDLEPAADKALNEGTWLGDQPETDATEEPLNEAPETDTVSSDEDPENSSDDSSLDSGRRDDWGEKIGGARKDEFRAGNAIMAEWNEIMTPMVESITAATRHPDADYKTISMEYSGDTLMRARDLARKPKLASIWPEEDPRTDYESGREVLAHSLSNQIRSRIVNGTGALDSGQGKKNIGDPVSWALLGLGYTAQVEALFNRMASLKTNEQVLEQLRQMLRDEIAAHEFEIAREVHNITFSPQGTMWSTPPNNPCQATPEQVSAIRESARIGWHTRNSDTRRASWTQGKLTAKNMIKAEVWLSDEVLNSQADRNEDLSQEEMQRRIDGLISRRVGDLRGMASELALHKAINGVAERKFAGNSARAVLVSFVAGLQPTDEPNQNDAVWFNRVAELGKQAGQQWRENESEQQIEQINRQRVHLGQKPIDPTSYDVETFLRSMSAGKNIIAQCEHMLEQLTEIPTLAHVLGEKDLASQYSAVFGNIYKTEQNSTVEKTTDSTAEADDEIDIPNLIEKKIKKPVPPRYKDLKRFGPERRPGDRDVTEEEFAAEFGIRGIEYGEWVTQAERQAMLNLAYDSLADMAEALNVPRKFMGFDGRLALAFGARGRGGTAAAHYEPLRHVINLTKTMGAGTLAHEWSHALDHWLSDHSGLDNGDRYLSEQSVSLLRPGSNIYGKNPHQALHLLNSSDRLRRDLDFTALYKSAKESMLLFVTTMCRRASENHDEVLHSGLASEVMMAMKKRLVSRDALTRRMGLNSKFGSFNMRKALAAQGKCGSEISPESHKLAIETTQEIAANWQDRMEPFFKSIESKVVACGNVNYLFPGNQYGASSMIDNINTALKDASLPELSELEKVFCESWLEFKDWSWLHKKVRELHNGVGANLVNATKFLSDAVLLDGSNAGSNKSYWSSGRELFARGFSTVIHERMKSNGIVNDFASKYSDPDQFTEEKGYLRSSNPEGPEVNRFVEGAAPLIEQIGRFSRLAHADRPTRAIYTLAEQMFNPSREFERNHATTDMFGTGELGQKFIKSVRECLSTKDGSPFSDSDYLKAHFGERVTAAGEMEWNANRMVAVRIAGPDENAPKTVGLAAGVVVCAFNSAFIGDSNQRYLIWLKEDEVFNQAADDNLIPQSTTAVSAELSH